MKSAMTIIVAVGDPDTRTALTGTLREDHHAVIVVDSGAELLQTSVVESPDLIILDRRLPDLDGFDCARRLRAGLNTQSTPVFMIAGAVTPQETIAALAAGCDHYFSAAIDPVELGLRTRSVVRMRGEASEGSGVGVLGEHARVMTLLVDFSRRLAGVHELSAVIEEAASSAAQMMCSRRVSIMMPDDDETHLTVATSLGVDQAFATDFRCRVGEGVAGRVFATEERVVLESRSALPPDADDHDGEFFSSMPSIVVPLSTSERTIGVLSITGRQDHKPFTPLDIEYIELVANITAAMIEDILSRAARDQSHDSIVIALAKLAEYRDNDTGKHLDRVTRFALMLAEQLRTEQSYSGTIDDGFLSDLTRAVPLHDIGKVAIPDQILLKPGRLTEQEMEVMRTHADIGASTIQSILDHAPGTRFLQVAEQIARGHHEWYDGNGYPNGISGEAIPLPARITAIADVYDALTTRRPYKEPMPHEKAASIILGASGLQFDPAIVAAFQKQESRFIEVAAALRDDFDASPDPIDTEHALATQASV